MKRTGAMALALTALLGLSVLGCDRGTDGSSPQPAPTGATAPLGGAVSTTAAPSTGPVGSTVPDSSARDGRLSDDEIAGIEKELDAIDDLLDDLDTELRSD